MEEAIVDLEIDDPTAHYLCPMDSLTGCISTMKCCFLYPERGDVERERRCYFGL